MIKEFVLAWDKNKYKLEDYFRTYDQSRYSKYEDLVRLIFDIVINPEMKYEYNTEDIRQFDDGDCGSGTLIFVLRRKVFQPEIYDYVYTNTYYGTCSGCDALMAVNNEDPCDLPTDEQVSDYMTLCLHLLQRCARMMDGEES